MDIQRSLEHLVKAWREAQKLNKALTNLGYSNTPYFELAGHISDAIYSLLGENTDTFDESITCIILTNELLSDLECADVLYHEHQRRIANDYLSGRIAV